MPKVKQRKPSWLKVRMPAGERFRQVRGALVSGGLHTVCQEANCPNMGECWESGTATFMILGNTCTRGCRFCAVTRGNPEGSTDLDEPARVADAVSAMGLDFAVITSVTRDDLPDGGASVFVDTVRALKALNPSPLVELLIPDIRGNALDIIVDAKPDVLAHNIEVVERLTTELRHRKFTYNRSLSVLKQARDRDPDMLLKSSIMLGLGESDEELESAMKDLLAAGVQILVLGQYLQPTRQNAEVVEYVPPERFDTYAERAKALGFGFVAAGPLVRTSYKAAEAYARQKLG